MKFTRTGLPSLTPREVQVLQAVWDGHSSPEIGKQLKIAAKTVDAHRANLMAKLRVSNVMQLLRLAVQHKLVKG